MQGMLKRDRARLEMRWFDSVRDDYIICIREKELSMEDVHERAAMEESVRVH